MIRTFLIGIKIVQEHLQLCAVRLRLRVRLKSISLKVKLECVNVRTGWNNN